jgi:DNA-directed RNA polymerase subunit RPC12/RpoP
VTVFLCANCGKPVTAELTEGQPLRGPERPPGHEIAPPRMAQGTYKLNYNASLWILNPDDVPGTALHPDARRLNGCCGLAGHDGPNLVCANCGADVATKECDCWTDNLVALIAEAVIEERAVEQ